MSKTGSLSSLIHPHRKQLCPPLPGTIYKYPNSRENGNQPTITLNSALRIRTQLQDANSGRAGIRSALFSGMSRRGEPGTQRGLKECLLSDYLLLFIVFPGGKYRAPLGKSKTLTRSQNMWKNRKQ